MPLNNVAVMRRLALEVHAFSVAVPAALALLGLAVFRRSEDAQSVTEGYTGGT